MALNPALQAETEYNGR